jgi:hypothetical protein
VRQLAIGKASDKWQGKCHLALQLVSGKQCKTSGEWQGMWRLAGQVAIDRTSEVCKASDEWQEVASCNASGKQVSRQEEEQLSSGKASDYS